MNNDGDDNNNNITNDINNSSCKNIHRYCHPLSTYYFPDTVPTTLYVSSLNLQKTM